MSKAFIGDLDETNRRFFTIVVDSKDEDRTMGDLLRAIQRLKEYGSINYVAEDDRTGHLLRKLLEYEARRDKKEVLLTLERVSKSSKVVTKPAEPATAVVIKAEGRTFADLLREMKSRINKKDTGDILSVRRGPNEELHLKVKAGKGVEELRKTISDKVEGAVVRESGRNAQKVPSILRIWTLK